MESMVLRSLWSMAQPYVGSAVRHGLSMASGYLVAKGLPGLDNGTVDNLTALATGIAVAGVSYGMSALEKYSRPVVEENPAG